MTNPPVVAMAADQTVIVFIDGAAANELVFLNR
jgi:hypothetical protein